MVKIPRFNTEQNEPEQPFVTYIQLFIVCNRLLIYNLGLVKKRKCGVNAALTAVSEDKIQTNEGERIWRTKINADMKCAVARRPVTPNTAAIIARMLRIRTSLKSPAIAAIRVAKWFRIIKQIERASLNLNDALSIH